MRAVLGVSEARHERPVKQNGNRLPSHKAALIRTGLVTKNCFGGPGQKAMAPFLYWFKY